MTESTADLISAIAAISDPLRRSLYEFVSRSSSSVSRDQAAAALGMARSTAAFHLDRLVSERMLDVEFKRLSGRTGPGSGRPSKLYRQAEREIIVSIPARRYELAGELLAAAVEESDRSGEPVREVLSTIAVKTGQELGAEAGSLGAALETCGYEPRDDGEGGMVLTNCPFHKLATSHTDVICHANLGLLQGVADGAADSDHNVEFVAPDEGHCCVRITAREGARA